MARRRLSLRLRRAVARRADFLGEYCHLRQDLCPEPFEIDPIIPQIDGGRTVPRTFAWPARFAITPRRHAPWRAIP